MAGTYATALIVLLASGGLGGLILRACGRREWSWLAPAVGLGLLSALAWGLVSATGEPAAALAVIAPLAIVGAALVVAVARAGRAGVRLALAIASAALLVASLPFLVEGRFGILGTSLNPDMSQHLFAADRLLTGGEERLAAEGYPLGPHALAAAITEGGPGLVQAFGGLTLAIAVIAALTPLALLGRLAPGRRALAALLVAFTYMSASYLVQGAFKETLQATLVLAFAVALHELAAGRLGGLAPAPRWRLAAAVPLAALAAGSVYAYSFPGLAWLAGALGAWALAELIAARGLAPLRSALLPAAVALGALALAVAPELGRISTFAEFETFDPDGPGLGNLFNPISPLEALGIWPSGDFRLDPGAGFAPAAAFWLGGLLGLAALAFGLAWWLRRGERAVPAALAAAALFYVYALAAGTPYQEAKAIAIAAPLAMLIAARALLSEAPAPGALRRARAAGRDARGLAVAGLAVVFASAAAGCSLLALANGPVGPDRWGPELIELRESGRLGPGGPDGDDTLVLASQELLTEEHGEDLLLWELRGGNVCAAEFVAGGTLPGGIEHLVLYRGPGDLEVHDASRPGPGPGCPFIADGARADPGAE